MPIRSRSIQLNRWHAVSAHAITSAKSTLPQPVPGSCADSGLLMARPHCSLYPALHRTHDGRRRRDLAHARPSWVS